MQKDAAEFQAEVLLALAHPNRIRILEELREGVRCNCEIAPALKLEQSNLSRHLKILLRAGVLISWNEGSRVNFKVADQRIFKTLDLVADLARRDVKKRAEALAV